MQAKAILVTYSAHKVFGLVRIEGSWLGVVFRQNCSPPACKALF